MGKRARLPTEMHRFEIRPESYQTRKKSGRPLTPKRPAFAFLVTPKLPAKRGEVLN